MLLTLILIIFIYLWGKELLGRWWALLPAFLFSLSPTVLTHGHYITHRCRRDFGNFLRLVFFCKISFNPIKKISRFRRHFIRHRSTSQIFLGFNYPLFYFLIIVFYIREVAVSKKFFIQAFQYIKTFLLFFNWLCRCLRRLFHIYDKLSHRKTKIRYGNYFDFFCRQADSSRRKLQTDAMFGGC